MPTVREETTLAVRSELVGGIATRLNRDGALPQIGDCSHRSDHGRVTGGLRDPAAQRELVAGERPVLHCEI